MKVILETMAHLDYSIRLSNDNINIYSVNIDDIYNETGIVLDKHSIIMQQLYYRDWVFINTIFSFLCNLKKWANTLYYKKLHTKFLESYKAFLRHSDHVIYLYEAPPDVIEYLEVECIDYEIIDSAKDLIHKLNNIF